MPDRLALSDDHDPAAPAAGADGVPARGESHPPGDGGPRAVDWLLPEESPVALVYNRRTFAVMLATPRDLGDFALGFSLSEGVVAALDEVDEIVVERHGAGFVARMRVPSARAAALVGRRRALEGRSGCGLCGVESLDALAAPPPGVRAPQVAPAAVARAFAALADHQPMRARVHSVHAAAWCAPDGTVLLAREDVGRHCALDKLIGAASAQGVDFAQGFALLSSRCGFELVQKAARVGIGLLACVSAPTGFARRVAAQAGMTLAARGAGGAVVLFPPGEDPAC